MGKALIYSYDKRRDVLYVSVGQPREAISREVQPGIFVHRHSRTRQVVGYALLDFQRRASRTGKKVRTPAIAIPVQASFRMPTPRSRRRSATQESVPYLLGMFRMFGKV